MSSGHTSRGGRGNRRSRRGSQRPRGPDGQNGQTHSSSAMLIFSSGGRQTPAHASREIPSVDEEIVLEEELDIRVTEELDGVGEATVMHDGLAGTGGTEAEEAYSPTDSAPGQEARLEKQGQTLAPLGGGGSRERTQPYAPGMRSHTHPLVRRGPASERNDAVAQSTTSFSGEPSVSHQAAPPPAQHERGASREMPAIHSRSPRAEHDDLSEHAPLRPEVRGEVGPLIDALHAIFEQDRAVASQGGTTRCGICYLHFSLADLEYREVEGYYVCHACARSLGPARLPMVRRQQRA